MRTREPGLAWALCILLGAGCSSAPSNPPPGAEVDPLEQDALNALELNLGEQADASLSAALARYQSLDDLAGQWRVHLVLTRLAKSRGDMDAARTEVETLRSLARQLGTPDALFETHLLLAQILDDARYFDAALRTAPTPLKRAVALTYLSREAEAMQLVDANPAGDPGDLAFIRYRYALASGSSEEMQRALAAYRRAGDPRGIADCLVYLARHALRSGDLEDARQYGQRAVTVLASIGDVERTASVQRWLDEL